MSLTLVALDCGLIEDADAADRLADQLLQIAGALQVELYLGLGLRTRVEVALYTAASGDPDGAIRLLAELGLSGITDPDGPIDPLVQGSFLVGHASPRTHERLGQVVLQDRWRVLRARLPDAIEIHGLADGSGPASAAQRAAQGGVAAVQVWTEDRPLQPETTPDGPLGHALALVAARLAGQALDPQVVRPLCVHRTPLWWGHPDGPAAVQIGEPVAATTRVVEVSAASDSWQTSRSTTGSAPASTH